MANYCNYILKVTGTPESREHFYKRITNDYNEPLRIPFYCNYITVEEETEEYSIISGMCAWSVDSCCRSHAANGIDLLELNTLKLNLEIEIWGREVDGGYFEEHYVYKNGECLVDESAELTFVPKYWDKEEEPTFEGFLSLYTDDTKQELQRLIKEGKYSEDMYDEDGEYIGEYEGSFPNWGEWSI